MIKRILLLCSYLFMLTSQIQAQEIRVKSFDKLERDLFARTNPRLDLNDNPCSVIRFVTPTKGLQFEGNIIGEPLYFAGETIVYMTKGSKRVIIKHPDYGVLRYEFPNKLDKQCVYEVPLKMIENPDNRTRALLLGTVNVSTKGQVTPGIMLGFVKRWGGYIKGISNFRMHGQEADLEVDNEGNYNGIPVWLDSDYKIERTALTVGGIYRAYKLLYTYAGLGYGFRNVVYEGSNNTWIKNTERSYEGFEAECGAIFRVKGLSLLLGIQTNQFKYLEFSGGIGYIF